MAEAYLETTVWEDGSKNINHTYYLEGDKMLAYIRYGTTEPFWFNKPITISRKGRKFVKVNGDNFSNLGAILTAVKAVDRDPDVVEVKGSKPGVVYLVNKVAQTCTCPGFTYRGDCKHLKEM